VPQTYGRPIRPVKPEKFREVISSEKTLPQQEVSTLHPDRKSAPPEAHFGRSGADFVWRIV
jgi:hypothetical protein